jgi:hypothetical protein
VRGSRGYRAGPRGSRTPVAMLAACRAHSNDDRAWPATAARLCCRECPIVGQAKVWSGGTPHVAHHRRCHRIARHTCGLTQPGAAHVGELLHTTLTDRSIRSIAAVRAFSANGPRVPRPHRLRAAAAALPWEAKMVWRDEHRGATRSSL